MKKLLPALLTALLCTSCVEHEAISFEGMIVGIRHCSSPWMDNNPGFIVKLFSPDSIGGTMTDNLGQTMSNLIILYESPRYLEIEDTIHGTFYLDDKYSRANCSLRYDSLNLPEGVFLKVAVD